MLRTIFRTVFTRLSQFIYGSINSNTLSNLNNHNLSKVTMFSLPHRFLDDIKPIHTQDAAESKYSKEEADEVVCLTHYVIYRHKISPFCLFPRIANFQVFFVNPEIMFCEVPNIFNRKI